MKWMLKFRRANDPKGGMNVVVVECREDELQSEKERIAIEMEAYSGEAWFCAEIVPFETQRRRK